MKKYLSTIIALVVIVLVAGGFFIVKCTGLLDPKPSEEPDPDDDVVTGAVFSFFTEDPESFSKVVKIESVNGGESLVLEKKSGEWYSTSHPGLSVISKNVTSCLNSMKSLNGRVAYDGEMTESKRYEFGFEESTTYIELTLSDGTVHKVIIGKDNQNGGSGYAWETGTGVVYLVSKYQLYSTLIDAVDLVNAKIFVFDDPGQISKVTITKDGSDYLKLQAVFSAEVDVARSWTVKYPIERKGDTTTIEGLVSSLTSILMTGIQELNCEDLSKYGLSPAKFRVAVTDPNKTVILSIGNMTPDRSSFYVTVDNGSDVYLVSSSYVTFTDTTLLSFMDEYIFMVSYTKLKEVDIDILGRKYVLTYDATGERDDEVFTINGTNVYFSKERDYRGDFKRIGTAIYGIVLTGLEDEPAEKGECLCRIRYEENDGTVNTVECFDRDGSTMYLYLNGVYQGGYGNTYLLTSDNKNYGIFGTIENLYSNMGIEDPQAASD